MAKVILVKLLSEYEFRFVGKEGRPENQLLHEFVFFHPDTEVLMRRRGGEDGDGGC